MATVIIAFDQDEDCVDPLDAHKAPRRHVEVIPDGADVLVIWRTKVGDPDKADDEDNHEDIHVVGMGVYESITLAQAHAALAEAIDTAEDGDEPYRHAT